MSVVDVLYDVGSRDEHRSSTGMAHLFEHLMFGGSVNIPSFDKELEAAGGKCNAWTGTDFTNFYDVLPARNIETAFHLESDRMLALAFSHTALETQRGVVIEEFKQVCLNQPYGDAMHHLRRMAYSAEHPYSWPTIGLKPEHIASATDADVRRWFYSHYAPDNAILAITSPLPYARIEELTAKWFSAIPRRNIAPRRLPDPGFPAAGVSETVYGNVPQPLVIIAYPMGTYGSDEYYAADILTDILSAGRSARFVHNLIQGPVQGLFASADASITGSEHEGLLMLSAALASDSDTDIAHATAMMRAEFERLAAPGGITSRELECVFNNFEATERFNSMSLVNRTVDLATGEYHGEAPDTAVRRRRMHTPASLATVAAQIASRAAITLTYRPQQTKQQL